MTSFFGKCAPAVARFIHAANTDLAIAVCWFTHPDIFKALLEAARRGVRIRLAINYDQVNFNASGLDFAQLERMGALVLAFGGEALLHAKFAIADGQKVLTGSFNWTRADNLDCVTLLENHSMATQFEAAFGEWAKQCTPLSFIREQVPRPVRFQALYQPSAWTLADLRRCIVSGAKTWVFLFPKPNQWDNALAEDRYTLPLRRAVQLSLEQLGSDRTAWAEVLGQSGLSNTAQNLLLRFGLRVRQGDIAVACLPDGTVLGIGAVSSEVSTGGDGRLGRFVQWIPAINHHNKINLASKQAVQAYKGSGMAIISQLHQ